MDITGRPCFCLLGDITLLTWNDVVVLNLATEGEQLGRVRKWTYITCYIQVVVVL